MTSSLLGGIQTPPLPLVIMSWLNDVITFGGYPDPPPPPQVMTSFMNRPLFLMLLLSLLMLMCIFRKLSWKKSLAVKISLKRDTKYHQQSATCLDTNLLCSPVNLDTNPFFLFSFCSIKTDSLMLPISGDESPKERVKWLDGNQVGHFLFYYNPLWYMFGDIFVILTPLLCMFGGLQ